LVELLVVITIIGILIGLLLPAVQSARESGRKTQCVNNLKQLTSAAMQHDTAHQSFPTGGWGRYSTSGWNSSQFWSGDPNYGTERNQPGGWTYNILPFIEQQPVHDLGIGLAPSANAALLGKAAQTTISVFACPTRRTAVLVPLANGWTSNASNPASPAPPSVAARTDYAANSGTNPNDSSLTFPPIGTNTNGNPAGVSVPGLTGTADGVIFTLSTVTNADISQRGSANLIIFGEKYMDQTHYLDGQDPGDLGPIFAGFSLDSQRWGGTQPDSVPLPPMRDRAGVQNPRSFGSPHVEGLNVFTCDGSGHWLSYNVDPATFQCLCSRTNITPIDNSKVGW
jgi:type II secretory pathway pseudopilin PulG